MGCCKASGVDFRTWLIYFLDHVHDYDNDYTKDLTEILPDYLKAAGKLSPHSIHTNDREIIPENRL
ncbi:hypothetical protein GGR06_003085 [Bacteroides reticulotermitis]|nr:hypothetical protein [Bacteroides reticulotermitis]